MIYTSITHFNGFFPQCFAQFSTFVKSATDVVAQKNFPRSRDENQQQTQPTCDVRSGNRTQDTAVGGERFPSLLLEPQSLLFGFNLNLILLRFCRKEKKYIFKHHSAKAKRMIKKITYFTLTCTNRSFHVRREKL